MIAPRRAASAALAAVVLCVAPVAGASAQDGASAASTAAAPALEAGNLGRIHLTEPAAAGGATRGFVVLFSGADGWSRGDDESAAALARDGALVVGVDLAAYLRRIDAGGGGSGECRKLFGDIETVSRQIQRARSTTAYLSPIVAGTGEGGALAGAILAQAPAATLAGAVSLDPTEAVRTREKLCPGAPAVPEGSGGGFVYGPVASLPGFWTVGLSPAAAPHGKAHVETLAAAGTPLTVETVGADTPAPQALAGLIRPHLASPDAGTADAGGGLGELPLIEMPATERGPFLAIVLSGDGGWRDLDKTIAERLQSAGVSVVGWDCLRYFWSRRSPEQTARDLAAVIETYAARWQATKVALIGYSFGADVMPFAYDRLPDAAKRRVVQLSLLGFSDAADFEIRVAGWLGAAASKDALPTAPALAPIDPGMIQCFYGADEDDSACPALQGRAEVIRTAGGHHFDGDYGALAARTLDGLRRRAKPS